MAALDDGVEQWIRANVFSLVSALGGPGVEDGRYRLGHESLSVLKDIRRWLKAWDSDKNRLDVSRACADANLVKGDLLEVLATWSGDEHGSALLNKASLYSTDLLVLLTWPLSKGESETTAESLKHGPFIETAQASYKRAILHHDHVQILRQFVRVCLPALAVPRIEREPYDDSIIKVVLLLLRNVAAITQPEGVTVLETESDISRHITIDAFHQQDVFPLLLTIGSGVGDEFDGHDVELLDILFHLCKGVDVDRLFMEADELASSNTRELQGLIGKEKTLLAGYQKTAPSRHNRFGTMMWLKRDDGRMSTVFGQTAANEQTTLHEMDKSKKWKKPRRPNKNAVEDPLTAFSTLTPLTASARRHLRSFVEQFLDSSFNPLFFSLRRSIERELPRLGEHTPRLYFFLISWFLRAERARRRKRRADANNAAPQSYEETESFSLVAAVLNQETFVLLNRFMQSALDHKEWRDLTACMRCFTEVLQTIQEMLDSPLEDDQEIAENTLSRVFYEQTTHDRITSLLRAYKDQGFGFLDACTDLAHTFLRLLERYSKQNVDMQVRTIRRIRKQKKKAQAEANGDNGDAADDRATQAADLADAQRTSTERHFDFIRFSARFVNQASIETFVQLLKFYKELNTDQLKRVHRFLYRAAFKLDLSVYLMRLDIIMLLNKMIKGPEPMERHDSTFKEWEELARHLFRSLVKKVEDRPSLAVELLFTKIPNTAYYLEHGQEREIAKKPARLPAELEVKPGMETEQQIGVAVAILVNQAKSDHLAWVKDVLASASTERKGWEEEAEARAIIDAEQQQNQNAAGHTANENTDSNEGGQEIEEGQGVSQDPSAGNPEQAAPRPTPSPILVRPDNDERRRAISRDKHLRLLLTLIGFQKLEITESDVDNDGFLTSWTIPGSLSSSDLTSSSELISRFEFSPPSYEEGKSAEDFVRRKANPAAAREPQAGAPRRRAERRGLEDSDSEGGSIASDIDAALFPQGGPTARAPDGERKRIRRRRTRHAEDTLIPDEVLAERREARRKLERERAAKIKSQLFISRSDDESDQDRDRVFFESEAALRHKVGRDVAQAEADAAATAATKSSKTKAKPKAGAARKRKAAEATGSRSDSEADMPASKRPSPARTSRGGTSASSISASDSDADAESETALPAGRTRTRKRQRTSRSPTSSGTAESEADTDTTPPSSQRPSSGHNHEPLAEGAIDAAMASGSDKENAIAGGALPASKRRTMVIDSDSDE